MMMHGLANFKLQWPFKVVRLWHSKCGLTTDGQ